MSKRIIGCLFLIVCALCDLSLAQSAKIQPLGGTLIVAVPLKDGMVVCSDKRLFNDQTKSFNDNFVKIRKVDNNTLFVVTNTIGFLNKTSGKMEFDVFEITSAYVARHNFSPGPLFWDGLKEEIRKQLLAYLARQRFEDWPATDVANNKLLFNLVFFSTAGNLARSYSLSVFYEKAKVPVVYTPGMVRSDVRTPQVIGKGKDVMDYLSRTPSIAQDPSILRFDEGHFDIKQITVVDAVNFAGRLFSVTNKALPQTEVSATHDCSLLSYQNGFQWIDDLGLPIKP